METRLFIIREFVPIIIYCAATIGIYIVLILLLREQEKDTKGWKEDYQRVRGMLSDLRTEIDNLKKKQDGAHD